MVVSPAIRNPKRPKIDSKVFHSRVYESKWVKILGTILGEVSLDVAPLLGAVRELLQRLG